MKHKLLLAAGRWFSPGTLVSSTNKTDSHDITEILLKVVLNTITQNHYIFCFRYHQGNVYVIDVSQSVEHDHVHALEFLRKDCTNITGNVHVFEYRGDICFTITFKFATRDIHVEVQCTCISVLE